MGSQADPSRDNIAFVTNGPATDQYIAHCIEQDSSDRSYKQITLPGVSVDLLSAHHFPGLPDHLLLPAENIHVLLSTKSGMGKAEDIYVSVIEPLMTSFGLGKSKYSVLKTSSHESVRLFASGDLRRKANDGIPQTVLLLSGDGGVVDLINGALDGERSSIYLRPIVALFPLGTGNALFHSMYRGSITEKSDDLVLSVRTLFLGLATPLPMFCASFSPGACVLSDESRVATSIKTQKLYGAVVASYGFHATLVADSDTAEWRKHGDERFGMVAKELLEQPHAYKASVTLHHRPGKEGPTTESQLGGDEHAYVLSTMVSNLEKTFTISPLSKPLDGQMRIVHFGPIAGEEIMKIMMAAYDNGKHITGGSEQVVDYESIDGMKIQFLETGQDGKWRRVCIDGLIVRVEEGGWMNVVRVPGHQSAVDILSPTT